MKFRWISGYLVKISEAIHNDMKFRGISDGFLGFSDFFSGFSGGFQGDFQGNFRWISVAVSGGSQIVFRRFSVPLNQIVIPFRRYSEHKSPIVRLERRGHVHT